MTVVRFKNLNVGRSRLPKFARPGSQAFHTQLWETRGNL